MEKISRLLYPLLSLSITILRISTTPILLTLTCSLPLSLSTLFLPLPPSQAPSLSLTTFSLSPLVLPPFCAIWYYSYEDSSFLLISRQFTRSWLALILRK